MILSSFRNKRFYLNIIFQKYFSKKVNMMKQIIGVNKDIDLTVVYKP